MKTFVKTITTLMLGMALGSATLAAAAPATVKAVIADFKVVVNGETKALSKSPIVVDGTTYLPVREVANLVGADLNYDGANKKIELSTKGGNPVMTNPVKEKTSLKGYEIIDLLEKKYPDLKNPVGEKLSLTLDGMLTFGDKTFTLTHDGDYNYDITPLVENGIITNDDL